MSTDTKWSIERKERIAAALERAGATKACPRCDKRAFAVVDGFASWNVQADIRSAGAFGGPSVPVVLVICTNCGFVAPHAMGILSPNDLEVDK